MFLCFSVLKVPLKPFSGDSLILQLRLISDSAVLVSDFRLLKDLKEGAEKMAQRFR